MSENKKTTTTIDQNFGVDDEHWEGIQRIFEKRNDNVKIVSRIEERKQKKIIKKKKIASALSWINAFVSSTAICLFILSWIDKVIATDDPRFLGVYIIAYFVMVAVFGSVGEYIELQIWDKDYE